MRTVIEDTWFPACTRIRIDVGADELLFLRCSFDGGEIFIGHGVDRTVFSRCVFRGTSFSGQSLSERIATACHCAPPETEDTSASGPRSIRFRQ